MIFILQFVGEIVAELVYLLAYKSLSYEKDIFRCESPLERQEALDSLRQVVTQKQAGPWFGTGGDLTGVVSAGEFRVGCGKLWGPVLCGTISASNDGGAIVRGKFVLGRAGRSIYVLLAMGFALTSVLVLAGAVPLAAFCVVTSLIAMVLLVAGVCITGHKGRTKSMMKRRLAESVMGEE